MVLGKRETNEALIGDLTHARGLGANLGGAGRAHFILGSQKRPSRCGDRGLLNSIAGAGETLQTGQV